MNIKKLALTEISLMILTIFSFSYLIGITIPTVEANPALPTACCLETTSGGTCLDILQLDDDLCSSEIIPSSCSQVSECQTGCCYDASGGSCTLNAPKSSCEANGGNWSNGPECTISQCNIGCCILGSQAIPSTTRECTLLSAEHGFNKDFQPMDSSGYCEVYTNPLAKGACVSDSGDYSGEKNCIFTEKGICDSEFHEGLLCTSPGLGTLCVPSKETSCIEGKDQIYFLDSCGNQANVYDSSKIDDDSYWDRIIDLKASCSSPSADCGNCDYATGSICSPKNVTDIQPTHGDNVCLDLNCDNGRIHGESWCVYDYNTNKIAPVGSRSFMAKCLEGETYLEGCADFNQEICIQGESGGTSFSRCYPNDWRSCINANGKGDYDEVQEGCDELPQCQMFNDYFGTENLKESLDGFFAGFNPDLPNKNQGASGDVGSGSNENIPFCVPKYTPGFQFWSSGLSTDSSIGTGGSASETSTICSLGSFVCVSQMSRECTLASCDSWEDEANWECNVNGETSTIKTIDLPKLMAAMNERCRALGSCGTNIGIDGNLGFDDGFTLKRVKIDETGDQEDDISTDGYDLTNNYLSKIRSSSGLIKVGDMQTIPQSAGIVGESGGVISEQVTGSEISLTEVISSATDTYDDDDDSTEGVVNVIGGLGALGTAGLTGSAATGAGIGPLAAGGYAAAIVAVGAIMGYQIGKLISDNQDWSPEKASQFNAAMGGVGGAIAGGASAYAAATSTTIGAEATGFAGLGVFGSVGLIGAVIAALYAIYMAFIDTFDENQYYILQFTCEGWEPDRGGNCDACNNDARPCSENRCRSIGANCRYYDDLGEPGTCASVLDTWQATINPWQEVLAKGNSYENIGQGGFIIKGPSPGGTVKSWEPLVFGIITDKDAECKIDAVHTEDYYSMSYDMQSIDKTHHFMIASQFGEEGTLLMQTGENNYYIRCMNFAGEINEAEFAVQFDLSDEPDITPPRVVSTNPENNGYLKYEENSTELFISLSEPSECRINNGFDSSFESMEANMSCVTNPRLGVMGEWKCRTELNDLINNQNTFYIKCLDKPGANNGEGQRMQSQTYTYNIDKCSEGLTISSISPQDTDITTNNIGNIELNVQTKGCINDGDSACYYNFGDGDILFSQTNSTSHTQIFDSLSNGKYNISINCIDDAKNEAHGQTNISVTVDQNPPQLARIYVDEKILNIRTDEPARCAIMENITEEICDLEIDSSKELLTLNTFAVEKTRTYKIQCEDIFKNKNTFCQEVYVLE
jgi:hypothetical protein